MRLGSPDIQRSFLRMLDLTLDVMKHSISHPLARELRLRIILFSLRVLRVSSSSIGAVGQWRLKDKILSAGLSWFKYAPKWSYGSNMLQLKTEVRLISDVMKHLGMVSYIGAHAVGNYSLIPQKESLFQILLESEQARLDVWVHPLYEVQPRPDVMTHQGRHTLEVSCVPEGGLWCVPFNIKQITLKPLIRVAWDEHPALAIELVSRFPGPSVQGAVRWLLLNFPAKVISEAEALPILLGGELPQDVRFQLKVCEHSCVLVSDRLR